MGWYRALDLTLRAGALRAVETCWSVDVLHRAVEAWTRLRWSLTLVIFPRRL